MERLCTREISFQWLCGGVGVNYHTLCDFRVDNGDLLNRLLSELVAVLVKEGLVSLDRLSLDGLRVRAAAGAASFRRGESLKKHLDKATAWSRPWRARWPMTPPPRIAANGRRESAPRQTGWRGSRRRANGTRNCRRNGSGANRPIATRLRNRKRSPSARPPIPRRG